MELDAFSSRIGVGQGRVRPAGAAPAAGEYLFVLGEDEPGRWFQLAAGDRAEVSQQTDLTGVDVVRAHLTFRVPAGVPPGLAWEASLLVDGTKRARASCRPGRTRTLTDLAANVSKLSGVHVVAVRLELVGA